MENVLIILQVVAAVVLFVLIMMQTPKSDGLSAMGAQTSESSYKSKMGKEEVLATYTKYVAIAFFAISLILVFLKR
ncbi:MAG: preprotein translocase subunit SecG [Abditibacteriota bacterium]|nr:preprotein translocase subunit SecG [Abditibacteriota bacterium]